MPKLVIRSDTGESIPADFASASPFPTRALKKDPGRTAVYAVAALALLAFLVSMVALALMKPPSF